MVLTSVSCSRHNEFKIAQSNDIQNLVQKIDSISLAYVSSSGGEDISCQRIKSPNDGNSDSKKRHDKNNIIKQDMLGFGIGVLTGIPEGVIMGTVICPGIGSATGAAVDALTSGLAFAVVSSAMAVSGEKDIPNNAVRRRQGKRYSIKKCEDTPLFSEDIFGGNIGLYHNLIIQEMWQDFIEKPSSEYAINYTLDYLEINGICKYNNRVDIQNILGEKYILLENDNELHNVNADYKRIIDKYTDTFMNISSNDEHDYTQSVMKIISQFGLAEEDVLLLNGMLSTYYYSSVLWEEDL